MAINSLSTRVLVIDDDHVVRKVLLALLAAHGYEVTTAENGEDGLEMAAQNPPDLIILDSALPDIDGLEVVARFREWLDVPIVVLSGNSTEDDKVAMLDAGADDYMIKPCHEEELLARLRVAQRHSARIGREMGAAPFVCGDLKIDFMTRQVFARGIGVHLTPIQYKLLITLARHAGKVVTHQLLLHEVWGQQYDTESHYLRVYMTQLRHKIEIDPAHPLHLLTEPGVGYRLNLT